MTGQAALTGAVELGAMAAVIAGYLVLARRFSLLWNPLVMATTVLVVGMVVAVLGELLFGNGVAGVPAMLRRSAIGSAGWGVIIAVIVWLGRRVFVRPAS